MVNQGCMSSVQELEMTDKMSEKLDETLGKANKLESIESTLNNLCSKIMPHIFVNFVRLLLIILSIKWTCFPRFKSEK